MCCLAYCCRVHAAFVPGGVAEAEPLAIVRDQPTTPVFYPRFRFTCTFMPFRILIFYTFWLNLRTTSCESFFSHLCGHKCSLYAYIPVSLFLDLSVYMIHKTSAHRLKDVLFQVCDAVLALSTPSLLPSIRQKLASLGTFSSIIGHGEKPIRACNLL